MKLSIVIPVYNESATFPVLIERVLTVALPEGLDKEIVIVEGGSTDGTRELALSLKGRPGVTVILEDAPRGKGAAVRRGLAAATGDFVLIQDGDLEYDVAEYPRLIEPLLAGRADIVMGSRELGSPRSWLFRDPARGDRAYALFVNSGGAILTALFNFLYGTNLTDGATMFKFFRRADLAALTLRSDVFDYDWEIIAKLARRGKTFLELPVGYRARSRAEGKKIRVWRDGPRVLLAILRYRFLD